MKDDTISRAAAIDALDGEVTVTGRANAEAVRGYANLITDRIKRLPSAHPGCDEWCHDCKEYDPQKHCCPRWNRVIRQTVEELKSEQPEIIHCGDCRYWKNGHLCECLSKYGTFETEIYFYCGFAERRDE